MGTLKDDVWIRAQSSQDKGLGHPMALKNIADNLWNFLLVEPKKLAERAGKFA